MKYVKRLPILILAICIYLTYILGIIFGKPNFSFLLTHVSPILYVLSIISLFFILKEENSGYYLIKLSMIYKLLTIPVFILNFLISIFLAIFPFFWFGIFFTFVVNCLMLTITSLYSSFGINKFYNDNKLKGKNIYIIFQWIFCFDVVSSIIVFIKAKKILNNKISD